MIRITKAERDYLVTHGIKCGENGVSRTYTRYKHYYLAETNKNLQTLAKCRAEMTS